MASFYLFILLIFYDRFVKTKKKVIESMLVFLYSFGFILLFKRLHASIGLFSTRMIVMDVNPTVRDGSALAYIKNINFKLRRDLQSSLAGIWIGSECVLEMTSYYETWAKCHSKSIMSWNWFTEITKTARKESTLNPRFVLLWTHPSFLLSLFFFFICVYLFLNL